MRTLESYKNPKAGLILLIVVFSCIALFFTFLFFNGIAQFSKFDVDYSELINEELTFLKYERLDAYRTDKIYIVYFEEYEKPFNISTISDKRLDKDALKLLTKGEKLNVYYKESSSKKYDFEICEFSHNSKVLLSLPDYVETNQNNQIGMMIFCPIMIVMVLFLIGVFVYALREFKFIMKSGGRSMGDLGVLKIEEIVDGNVVRVFNSPNCCTLVINGKAVDKYIGVIAFTFRLSGSFIIGDRVVPVEAKMGAFYMKLYIDGKLVRSIFMGLG